MPLAIFLFLVSPQLIGKMQSNGAFEIYLDGDIVIFSKLKTGAFPTAEQLIQSLVAAGIKLR